MKDMFLKKKFLQKYIKALSAEIYFYQPAILCDETGTS